MAMGLSCWLALQPRLILKLIGWGSLPLLLGGLYVSGSRGPIVAAVIVLVLCMFLLPTVRRRVHEVVAAVGVAVLGGAAGRPVPRRGGAAATRLTSNSTTTVSDDGRREVLAQGLHDFHNSPFFGIGVQFIAEAHTLYVGVLAGGGIILGLGFVLFNVGSIRAAVQSLNLDRALAARADRDARRDAVVLDGGRPGPDPAPCDRLSLRPRGVVDEPRRGHLRGVAPGLVEGEAALADTGAALPARRRPTTPLGAKRAAAAMTRRRRSTGRPR